MQFTYKELVHECFQSVIEAIHWDFRRYKHKLICWEGNKWKMQRLLHIRLTSCYILDLENPREFTLLQKQCHELHCGTFLIVWRIESYRPKLSATIHVSLLGKKWQQGEEARATNDLPICLLQAMSLEFKLDKVVNMKVAKKWSQLLTMWLICWLRHATENDSGEPVEDIKRRFPDFISHS